MQYRTVELRYAVIAECEGIIACRARFYEKHEAEWYATNLWRASIKKEIDVVFRVIDIAEDKELSIYGSKDALTQHEITSTCLTLSA